MYSYLLYQYSFTLLSSIYITQRQIYKQQTIQQQRNDLVHKYIHIYKHVCMYMY